MGCDTEVEREQIDKYEFNTADKRIAVYPSPEPDSPIVYINTFEGEGDNVYRALENMDNPAFTLVAVSGLKWEHDMAPWDIPPFSKKSTPCIGGADDYLQLLREEIMPRAEKMADGVSWRGLAGYSLAGLFTVYSLYRTDLFSRIASVSGSLWFPGLMDYITSHEMKRIPDCVYFSLGDLERRTRKPCLKTVQENTERIRSFYAGHGIDTFFQLNPGNHFKNADQRTAAGISWILNRQVKGA